MESKNNEDLLSEFKEILINWWKFESISNNKIINSLTNKLANVYGNYKIVDGVRGNALKFDGFTTYVEYPAEKFLEKFNVNGFTLEAWIALGEYPWNWCPILDNSDYTTQGYYFGIDDEGHLIFYLVMNSSVQQWQGLISEETLYLRKWYHVAGTYDAEEGVTLYINGNAVGNATIDGTFIPAANLSVLIGKHRLKAEPTAGVKEIYNWRAHFPTNIFFDGIMDEIKTYNRKLYSEEIKKLFLELDGASIIKKTPAISLRKLPSGPPGKGRFGAYYTKLQYYEEWDSLWPVGPYTDVVVQFDQAVYKYIFWRGTSYIPCWVTDNGIWFTYEFNETWTPETVGCCEPMSDKQCRHSHVRIIENNDARVVIHWRYALIDALYKFARIDKISNWGEWSDEIYTIYPDGIGVKKTTLYSSDIRSPHEFQESIIVLSPGIRPEDAINLDAVFLMNMKGETFKYSWIEKAPERLNKPIGANIEYVNIKSNYKPFLIVSDAPASRIRKYPLFRGYKDEIYRSKFPWFNHWPVAQIPSDGRRSKKTDRAAHASVSNLIEWAPYEETPNSLSKILLHGLTDKPPEKLLQIAKSWLNPPELKVKDTIFISEGYDPSERAFILKCTSPSPTNLSLSILSNKESPIVNPCFIIKNWIAEDVNLIVNGEKLKKGKDYRIGVRHLLNSTDSIVWIQKEATYLLDIELETS